MRPSGGMNRCLGWLVFFLGVAFSWALIAYLIGYGIKASRG